MAFHDWNQDGKKEQIDSYIGHRIHQDINKSENPRRTSSESGGMSGFSAVVATIASIIIFIAIISSLFGDDISNIPAVLLLLIFAAVVAVIKVLFGQGR